MELFRAEDVHNEDKVALGFALACITIREVLGDDQEDAGTRWSCGQGPGSQPLITPVSGKHGRLTAIVAGVENLVPPTRVTPT